MFFGNDKLVAIDIGSTSVKIAEIDQSARGPILRKFSVQPFGPGVIESGEIADPSQVSTAIEIATRAAKSKRKAAITGLWGNSIIVKKIAMPRMEPKLVAEQIRWEAEQYIPFDINDISIEHHILGGGSAESMDVLLVAAKQESLFRFIESVEGAKLKCTIADLAGFALANCFEANYGKSKAPIAILDIGGGTLNFVVVEQGEVTFCRDVLAGGQLYTNEIHRSMGVSIEEAEALKISASLGQEVPEDINGIISNANEQMIAEVRNAFEFYAATSGGSQITKFYVCGGSMYVPGLVEQIAQASGIPFETFDPFARIQYDKSLKPAYIDQIRAISPVVLGLGLRKKNG